MKGCDTLTNKIIQNEIQKFCSNVDAEKWRNFVVEYEKIGDHPIYGGKHSGSDAEHEGAKFIAEQLKSIGVPKVEIIETPTTRYQFNDSTLTVVSEGIEPMEIKPYGYRSGGTAPEGITAELVDAGTATEDEYEKLDVKDKIVLFKGMDGALSIGNILPQIEETLLNKPAAILIYTEDDILNDDTIRVQTPLTTIHIPVVGISVNHAKYLKSLLSGGSVSVNLTVDADYIPDGGVTYNVLGEIPGKYSEEKILFSSHLDHFFRCLQDNMASCAAVLGIGEAIIKSGRQPNRSILLAFNGSHECGIIDSKHPYITGAYGVVQAKGSEWKNKVIADINFEYAALSLDKIVAVSSVGNANNLFDYLEYAPDLTGGFKEKIKGTGSELYYGLSWCDGIAYCTAGIPSYTNDILTEQMEGTSIYCGRDHSQDDNWEVFSVDALRDSIRYYGGFGVYLDCLPYAEYDFTDHSRRMHEETQFDELDKEGLKTGKMRATLKNLESSSAALMQKVKEKNAEFLQMMENGVGESVIQQTFDQAHVYNEKILKLFDYMQRNIEGLSPADFIVSRSGKYLMNVSLLCEAEEALTNGDLESAKQKLMEVDLASVSYSYSKEVVDLMHNLAIGSKFADRRTWARGRELKCASHFELMKGLKTKIESGNKDCKAELKLVKKANRKEMISFIIELKKEFKVIRKAIDQINEIKNMF